MIGAKDLLSNLTVEQYGKYCNQSRKISLSVKYGETSLINTSKSAHHVGSIFSDFIDEDLLGVCR